MPDIEQNRIAEFASLLGILANPTRLLILKELLGGTKCVNDIQDILDISQPNVSQHLAALKEKGLVVSHKSATLRCYHLAKPELTKSLFAWLSREYPDIDHRELETCPVGKPGKRALKTKDPGPRKPRKER